MVAFHEEERDAAVENIYLDTLESELLTGTVIFFIWQLRPFRLIIASGIKVSVRVYLRLCPLVDGGWRGWAVGRVGMWAVGVCVS